QQTKSGTQGSRHASHLRAYSKSSEEFLRVPSAPILPPGSSCNPATHRGNELRSVFLPPSQAPFVAEALLPACHAVNDRKSSPGQFRPTQSLSDVAPAAPVHQDALASLLSLHADESQPSCKSSRAARRTASPRPAFPAPAPCQSPPASSHPMLGHAPASHRDLPRIVQRLYARANRSVPWRKIKKPSVFSYQPSAEKPNLSFY